MMILLMLLAWLMDGFVDITDAVLEGINDFWGEEGLDLL